MKFSNVPNNNYFVEISETERPLMIKDNNSKTWILKMDLSKTSPFNKIISLDRELRLKPNTEVQLVKIPKTFL